MIPSRSRTALRRAIASALGTALLLYSSAHAGSPSASNVTHDVSQSLNEFGFRLLCAVTDGADGNVIVSPFSVFTALTMTYNGAADATKSSMASVLDVSTFSDDQLYGASRDLAQSIKGADPSVQLEIANALWIQSGFDILPSFTQRNHDFYDVGAESVDFLYHRDRTTDTINRWVNQRTHGKIPTIIARADPDTRLMLTDAIYFKGYWQKPFKKTETAQRDFHLRSGGMEKTPMMSERGEYLYQENESFQAIALPYGNGRFALYVVLPRKTDGLTDLVRGLSGARWAELVVGMGYREGKIVLPKFEVSWDGQLNRALESLGMADAFDSSRADFSLMHTPPPRLYINDVEHKTYLKVDEEGTKAAAATSVGMAVAAAVSAPQRPFAMMVDHPFFVAIVERDSEAVLFTGVITNPSSQ